jgi:hypothetical protein
VACTIEIAPHIVKQFQKNPDDNPSVSIAEVLKKKTFPESV